MARIVLIDDEARLLQTLARFLEQQGHQVVRGSSFCDVEAQLQPGQFEVLVTDIVMPEFDGMKVLQEVVGERQCQEPVILITGEPNLQTASEAVRRGAFDYISKPVTKDKLLEVVSRGLRHVQLLRERDHARQMEVQVLKNLAALGESASVLSHEIRTPITSLRHALRAVGDKLGIEDRVLIEEFVGNLNRIERMLGQTLSFAKPLALQRQDVAVGELVQRVVQEVGHLPMFAGMSTEVEIEPGLRFRVDPQLFGEVLTNLLRNAAEACGGKGHVTLRAGRSGTAAWVEVGDDGPGVAANLREEIFKPFRSSKDYGTGIGLAFCRKVVESHGGTIGLVPRPGDGACFRVDLPFAAITVPAVS
jgi:signal transduction histidine kinase